MKTMKLYLINTYEAQMASETGINAVCDLPTDTQYYKHEVVEEVDVELPDGFSIEKTIGGGKEIFQGKEDASLVTEYRSGKWVTSLVTSGGEVKIHEWKY